MFDRNRLRKRIGEKDGTKVIIITKLDAPKIVFDRVYEINIKRINSRKDAIHQLAITLNKMKKHSFKDWFFAVRPWSFPASTMPVLDCLCLTVWYCTLKGTEYSLVNGFLAIFGMRLYHPKIS